MFKTHFSLLVITAVVLVIAGGYSIAVKNGVVTNPFSNLSAVLSSGTSACYTPADVALLTQQKIDLEVFLVPASKIPNDKSINWHISEEEKAKKVLETEIATTTASLATLKKSIPTATVLATASKKIKDLRDEKKKLEAKTTKTVADTNRLTALPALIEVAVSAEVNLLKIAPDYETKSKAFETRKAELSTQIELKKKAIAELNVSKKTLTDNLLKVKKELTTAPSKLCSLLCLSAEEVNNSNAYTEDLNSLPSKIKTYEDRLLSSKANLDKYKKTMALEDTLRKKATPAAIIEANTAYLSAKTKYDDAFKKGVRGAALQTFVDAKTNANKKYEELKFAETRYSAAKITLESAENIIKTYPESIKTFKVELAEAKAKNPELISKATRVKGLKCDVPSTNVTTGTSGENTGITNNSAINPNLGANNLTPAQRAALMVAQMNAEVDAELITECETASEGGAIRCDLPACFTHPACQTKDKCMEIQNAAQNNIDDLDDRMKQKEITINAIYNNPSFHVDNDTSQGLNPQGIAEVKLLCDERADIDDKVREELKEYNLACPAFPLSLNSPTVNIPQCEIRHF